MLNAPVFQWDNYWLSGHGHSAYRFVAEQHLAKFTSGLSRSLYNFPLTVWYDIGPFGFLLWCVLFVQLLRRFKRIANHSVQPELRALASGLQAGLFGLATASAARPPAEASPAPAKVSVEVFKNSRRDWWIIIVAQSVSA